MKLNQLNQKEITVCKDISKPIISYLCFWSHLIRDGLISKTLLLSELSLQKTFISLEAPSCGSISLSFIENFSRKHWILVFESKHSVIRGINKFGIIWLLISCRTLGITIISMSEIECSPAVENVKFGLKVFQKTIFILFDTLILNSILFYRVLESI
jgi:hypothetical protein